MLPLIPLLAFITAREVCSAKSDGLCAWWPNAWKTTPGTGVPALPPGPVAPRPARRRPAPPPSKKRPAPSRPKITLDTRRLGLAKELADSIITDVKKKGRNYNRKMMRNFQRVAGLKGDGLYGPRTAGAVAFYSGRIPPASFYPKGAKPIAYKPKV